MRQPLEFVATAMPAVRLAGIPPGTDASTLDVPVGGPVGVDTSADGQPALFVTRDGFGVIYLVEEDGAWRHLTRSELRRAGMTAAELHPRSLRNLKLLADGSRPGLKLTRHNGFQSLSVGGRIEASLLLLDDLWDTQFKADAPNGAVLAIGAADACAFCDADAPGAIARLRDAAQQAHAAAAQPLTPQLYVRRKGRWHEHHAESQAAYAPDDLPPLDFTP